jgi:phosphate transport system substrate-binding protein
LKSAELQAAGLAQFPSVMGAVVPVVNIPGIKPGSVKLTGPIIADIFLGKINNWNDPSIAAVNAGVAFPKLKITVVHRSDGSGTTFNFVNYLSKVSLDWRNQVGEGTSVKWPVGIGGKGNEGVAAYTKQIKGAIGYVELSYAITNKLNYTSVRNRAGNFIVPSKETIKAAAASADWANVKDFSLVITDAPGDQAYPISATNFIMMKKKPKNPARNADVLKFFDWVYTNGDQSAEALGYVALPTELTTQIKAYWAKDLK